MAKSYWKNYHKARYKWAVMAPIGAYAGMKGYDASASSVSMM